LLLVIDGVLAKNFHVGRFFHHMDESRGSVALNLCVMAEAKHQDCCDEKKNENASDAASDVAKDFAAPTRANFPLSVNFNPKIFVCNEIHG
jgi:hypothetical protein